MTVNEKIDAWFSGREDEFAAALAPLIAIDSTLGTPAPGAPVGEGAGRALNAALALAKDWGLRVSEDDGYVGLVDLNENEDELHILAHMDVVNVGDGWDTDPFTMVRDGDLIYGRGTDDDKGPAVASLMAMRCVRELGLPLRKNVKLVLGTAEEIGSPDIAHYYAAHPYAPCSFSPDSDFPVTNGERGHYTPEFTAHWESDSEATPRIRTVQGGIKVNVAPGGAVAQIVGLTGADIQSICDEIAAKTGVSFLCTDGETLTIEAIGAEAHASTPDKGKNAICALLELLCALPLARTAALDTVRNLHALFPYGDNAGCALGIAASDAETGTLTLTFSMLKLDENGFWGQFDSRTPLCATQEKCADVVRARVEALGWSYTGEMEHVHLVDENAPFVRTLLRCYEHFSGKPGYCEVIGGGTYVHDIPGGVAFGAGDPGFESRLHGANERARLSQLLMAGRIFASVIAEVCA